MSICMKCEKNETSCFSSCDNCKKGLCDICSDNLQSLIKERSYEYQIKCTICKTNFYEELTNHLDFRSHESRM